jgi:carboxyl-terminal processing protease
MAIDGMLQELGDPHTGFLPAKEYENLRIQTQGEYGGLGISINKRNGWVTVINPLPGTPGERAGLRAGDQIIEVNGESAKGWTDDEAVAKLRGPKGTPVELKIGRLGVPEPIPFTIIRDEIHIKAVPAAYMLDSSVGYVAMDVFSESSTNELREAITSLQAKGAKGVILDVRQNSGGLLEQGVTVSDLFLERGQMVVETRGRIPNQNHKIAASHKDEYAGLPIVVLVGPESASATEILAGALQDHDRALVVGRTTYGKGSVQTVFRLTNDNWLKLTTARWYTPSGRSIQGSYGIDHPTEQVVEGADGEPVAGAGAGTDRQERPKYTTDAGRTVLGGGGITPDLTVTPDTLTADERILYGELLQKNPAKYFETRFGFGVRYNKEHGDLKPGFTVTQAMLDEFYSDLTKAGITVDRALYDAGRRWIDLQLGYEITMSRWGVAEARKRQNVDDNQVKVATDLLHKATSPQSLFTVAGDYDSAVKTAGKSQQ